MAFLVAYADHATIATDYGCGRLQDITCSKKIGTKALCWLADGA
jgi:hypothetical protein